MAKILIVDDEETIRKLLLSSTQRQGHEAIAVEDGFRACDVYEKFQPDALVSDIKMPKLTGFQMFDRLKEKYNSVCPVIFITGHGEKTVAVESLRLGAFDYLEKPFDMEDFSHRLQAAVHKHTMERENLRLARDLEIANSKLQERLEARTELVHRIQHPEKEALSLNALGNSQAIRPVKEAIAKLLESELGADMSVLLVGPSGSGKELVAHLIHDLSTRGKGPWVPVNCGALPENLVESELFGHEKGAFTGANARKLGMFELSEGGTLFLDEVGELPLPTQSKLLRALQERSVRRVGGNAEIKVDVRVVAATNRDLRQAIAAKEFREDLYFRLNNYYIQLPTLQERKEDITFFAEKLLAEAVRGISKAPRSFAPESLQILQAYDWPGNIRELKSVVQRAALLSNGNTIYPEALRAALGMNNVTPLRSISSTTPLVAAPQNIVPTINSTAGIPYHTWKKGYMQTMEREYLQQQLAHFHGNVSAMARAMKVSRPNLCRLLRKNDIHSESFRDLHKEDGKKAA